MFSPASDVTDTPPSLDRLTSGPLHWPPAPSPPASLCTTPPPLIHVHRCPLWPVACVCLLCVCVVQVWATGIMMFELMTLGERPYKGDSVGAIACAPLRTSLGDTWLLPRPASLGDTWHAHPSLVTTWQVSARHLPLGECDLRRAPCAAACGRLLAAVVRSGERHAAEAPAAARGLACTLRHRAAAGTRARRRPVGPSS